MSTLSDFVKRILAAISPGPENNAWDEYKRSRRVQESQAR